jgi:single-strand DNA-binding protein
MASFNKVLLLGNLTRDPQLRYLPTSNTAVADFGLAVNRKWKTPQGEEREEVCFVDCTAWARSAEVINQYCQKGRPIFIEGRLKLDQWDDKTSGQKRSKLTVVVESFQLLGSGPGGAGQGGGQGGGQGQSSGPPSEYDSGDAHGGAPSAQPAPQRGAAPAPAPRRPAPQASAQAEPPITEDQHFKPDDIPF